jgi:hypothetical protein
VKRPDAADFAFAALLIIIGIAPILTVPGWQGYGPHGEFSCSCGQYYVRFSDPTYGGDKPHVFALYQGFQVDLVELSDDQSTVNGLNMYWNFTTTQNVSGGALVVDYSSHGLNFTKTVSVSGGAVHVDYSFSESVNATLTFWRWYYFSIGPYDRPVTREILPNATIPFSVFGQGAVFNASLAASPAPAAAEIFGVEGGGLNKIALQFVGEQVDLSINLNAVKALAGAGVVEVASSNEAFPILGVAAATVYLGARTWVRGRK